MLYSEIMKLEIVNGRWLDLSGDSWKIDRSAIIAASARIGAFSEIGPYVEIGDDSRIGEYVQIERSASIGRSVHIGSHAFIWDSAVISESVAIAAEVRIGPHVHVVGSPLQIVGPEYVVYPFSPGLIGIGCQIGSIVQWEKSVESLAGEHDISDEDVLLYRDYVELIRDWMVDAEAAGTFFVAKEGVTNE